MKFVFRSFIGPRQYIRSLHQQEVIMCGFLVHAKASEGLEEKLQKSFQKVCHRGPDRSQAWKNSTSWWGFHRLAIMDTSAKGDQPFLDPKTGSAVVCNGEIYNFEKLTELVDHKFVSGSDCEVLLPVFRKYGIKKLCEMLDGEYVFVLFDGVTKKFYAARDPMGIRPMFWGKTEKGAIMFASEMKGLHDLCKDVHPFPPGHWFDGESFHPYIDLTEVKKVDKSDLKKVTKKIHSLLIEGVNKRLQADVPVGFLLSGGLDSSLVCAIAAKKIKKPLKTFSIGMAKDAIDLKYARIVSDFLKTEHHEVIMSEEDVIDVLPELIRQLETWDITTIRASVGMYLVCKYIREKTDVRVLLTGEVSDELFGYKYTDFAPDAKAFQEEAAKRIREIYFYDVLRADRCISSHGLEARVPFSDTDFVQYVMSIDPEMKRNKNGIGKYLLRMAFKEDKCLPESILMREKAAFSDAVGHSMVDIIRAYAEKKYTDDEFKKKAAQLGPVHPISKEALLYREIFSSFYKGREALIPAYWLPNTEWTKQKVLDPSARYLSNYGASGE